VGADVPHPEDAELVQFDEGNESHLAERNVTPAEVLQVFNNDPLWAANVKGRTADWLMIGRTRGGRPLLVAVTYDEVRAVVRPITARTCEKDEISRWSV
jgi:uncharacterized DUF497 family protein